MSIGTFAFATAPYLLFRTACTLTLKLQTILDWLFFLSFIVVSWHWSFPTALAKWYSHVSELMWGGASLSANSEPVIYRALQWTIMNSELTRHVIRMFVAGIFECTESWEMNGSQFCKLIVHFCTWRCFKCNNVLHW